MTILTWSADLMRVARSPGKTTYSRLHTHDYILTMTYSLLCNGEQTDNNTTTATATATNRKAYLDVGDRNVAEGLEAHLPMHAYASAMTT